MKTTFNKTTFGQRSIVICALLLLLIGLGAPSAQAQTRLVVRDSLGLPGINLSCALLGCNVVRGLGDPQGQLFLVTFPALLNPVTSLLRLNLQLGVVGVELDQVVRAQEANAGPPPSYLTDETPTNYYGATVWHGYAAQPPTTLIRTSNTQSAYHVPGFGVTVAVFRTAGDPTNPALQHLPLPLNNFPPTTTPPSAKSD